MSRAARIETILRDAFAPSLLEVIDESARHAGHAGAAPGGETHFRLRIRSAALLGLGRVAAHRQIYAALDSELKSGLHALAIELVS